MMTTTDRFFNLFVNRTERVGLSEPSLGGKERSVPTDKDELHRLLEAHLTGVSSEGVGCYAVDAEGLSRWGCYDFDAKTSDPARDASYAAAALERAGLHGVVEISRSGEGRHVWVFLDEPVPADELRKCLLLIDEAAGLECSEINPKQRIGTDHSKNLGNYVRLPYHARWVGENRMVCLDSTGPMDLELFLSYTEANKSPAGRIMDLASRYFPKPPPLREVPVDNVHSRKTGTPTQDAHLIMRGDIISHEGGFFDGRNNKLWNFACYLAGHPGYDLDAAQVHMERVWSEQLVQEPDVISLDECRSMIERAFDAQDIR